MTSSSSASLPSFSFAPLFLLILTILAFCSSSITLSVDAQNTTVLQPSDLFTSLFSAYDNQLRPNLNTTNKPVRIDTALRINLLYNVDSKEETFQLDLFVNEYWIDPRLAFDSVKYPFSNTLRIPAKYTPWLPDTFFFNAIKCQALSDQMLTLKNDGNILWSRHQSCTFHSGFDLLTFPFDSQTLIVRRTSFSYTDDELTINFLTASGWRPDPQYDFTNSLWDFNRAWSNRTSLSFLNARSADAYLAVERKSLNYILKMIMPMFLLVLLSTLSYAIDPSSPPARVAFSVALILSIVTFNSVVSQDLPKINYATMLDWYVWYCFLVVVSALGEYAWVNNLMVSKKYGVEFPYLVDDFALWTAPFTWIVINLWYWPLYDSPAVHICLAMVYAPWVAMNVYRCFWWNRQHGKRGLWEPMKAFYFYCKLEYRKRYNAEEYEAEQQALADAEERKEQALDAQIELAATTGVNVFEVGSTAPIAGASSSAATHDTALPLGTEANPSPGDEPNPFDSAEPLLHDSPLVVGADDDDGVRHRNVTAADEEYVDPTDEEAGQNASELNLV